MNGIVQWKDHVLNAEHAKKAMTTPYNSAQREEAEIYKSSSREPGYLQKQLKRGKNKTTYGEKKNPGYRQRVMEIKKNQELMQEDKEKHKHEREQKLLDSQALLLAGKCPHREKLNRQAKEREAMLDAEDKKRREEEDASLSPEERMMKYEKQREMCRKMREAGEARSISVIVQPLPASAFIPCPENLVYRLEKPRQEAPPDYGDPLYSADAVMIQRHNDTWGEW